MEFRVLGPLEVAYGEETVTIGSAQQRRLLAVLLVHAGEVVSADRLVDELWGERPPATALQSLWTCVARLRGALAVTQEAGRHGVLVTRTPGYLLRAEPDDIDAVRFERLVAEASRVGTDEPRKAVERLDEALGLWRGPAFAEFADAHFASAEAARLEELRLVAIEQRFDAELVLGRHAATVGALQRYTAEHPLREFPRAQLMLALYRCGRQAEALEAYQTYRDLLDEELGLEPSGLLRARQSGILRQSPELDWRPPPARDDADRRPAAAAERDGEQRPSDHGLPVEVTSFVGRQRDLAAVLADLNASRLVTLTGVGGVGKTRLAVRAAAAAASRYPDGVSWCELAPVTEAAAVGPALATSLGVRRQPATSITESVVSFLATKRLLLVVDNCEHVLDAAGPLLEAIIRGCPGVVVLATGRTRLGIASERTRAVHPLPLPEKGQPPGVEAPAVALFVDRARTVRPDLDLTGPNVARIAELCERLDGLPLAIELAAARARSLNPADLADRVSTPFDLLTSVGRPAAERHSTLRGVIDWSYGLLGTGERRLFNRLAVFAGGFGLAAAGEVCTGAGIARGEVVDLLTALVDASMVTPGPTSGETRYSLLQTLRQYGLERLRAEGERDPVRLAHARYYVALAERADAGLRGPAEGTWVTVVDRDLDNLRAAHLWSMEEADADLALRLSGGLRYYAHRRFHDEVVSWGEAAVGMPGASEHPLYALVCGAIGEGLTARGELAHATALAERALAHATQPDDHRRVFGLRVAGMAALYAGRLDDGFRDHKEMLRLARLHDDTYEMGMALLGLSQARIYADDPEGGLAFADEQYRVAEMLDNPSMLALARYDQAEALSDIGPEQARERYEQAIQLAGSAGSTFIVGIAMVGLASLLGRAGEPGTALPLFRTIIDHWHRMGIWQHQWTTLRNLVQLFVRIGRNESAAVLLGAIAAASTAAPAYGADAERMDRAAHSLEGVLGPVAWAAAIRRGAAMSGDEAVDFARAAIDAAFGPAHT